MITWLQLGVLNSHWNHWRVYVRQLRTCADRLIPIHVWLQHVRIHSAIPDQIKLWHAHVCGQCKKNHVSSSSSSSYSHVYVGSMYDDIRLRVPRSCTSSAHSPFPFISSFTLSNHLLLYLPLFLLPCTFISIALLPTQVLLFFSSHAHTPLYNKKHPRRLVPLKIYFLNMRFMFRHYQFVIQVHTSDIINEKVISFLCPQCLFRGFRYW